MRANRILIAAVLISFFPAVAFAQLNVSIDATEAADTELAAEAGKLVFTAGPAGLAADTIKIDIGIKIDNTVSSTGIQIASATGAYLVTSPTITITDAKKGLLDLVIVDGNKGDKFDLRGIRLDVAGKTAPIQATITPTANAILVDGLPANKADLIKTIKTGISVSTDDTADILSPVAIKVDDEGKIVIKEGFDTAFKTPTEADGLVTGSATQGVEIDVTFVIPSGMKLDLTLSGDDTTAVWDSNDNAKISIDKDDTSDTIQFTGTDPGDDEKLNIAVKVTTAPTDLAVGTVDFTFTLVPSTSTLTPRFNALKTTVAGVTILPGTTNLLMPFVSTEATFDTGIFISNTTADPFGTANGATAQSGTVTFNFFPNDGSAAFSYTTAAGSPGTGLSATGEIASGITYTVLATQLLSAAGFTGSFSGYVFAITNFTHAHAAGFISDFANFTQGTPALVLPPVQINQRSKQAVEDLDN